MPLGQFPETVISISFACPTGKWLSGSPHSALPEVELAHSFSKDSFAGCGILGWQVFSPLFSTFNM